MCKARILPFPQQTRRGMVTKGSSRGMVTKGSGIRKTTAANPSISITSVFTAIIKNKKVEFIERLLARGALRDIDEVYNGNCAAHHAAYHGRTGVLQLLADWGADFKRKNKHGETPLDSARSGGQSAAVAFLLAATLATQRHDATVAVPTATAPAVEAAAGPALEATGTEGRGIAATAPADTTMHEEVKHACTWLTSGVANSAHHTLEAALQTFFYSRYASHWHVDAPTRGTAYRSVDTGMLRQALGAGAAHAALISALTSLPSTFTLWCDPGHVSVRMGNRIQTLYDTAPTAPVAKAAKGNPDEAPAPLSPKAHTFAPAPSTPASPWSFTGSVDANQEDWAAAMKAPGRTRALAAHSNSSSSIGSAHSNAEDNTSHTNQDAMHAMQQQLYHDQLTAHHLQQQQQQQHRHEAQMHMHMHMHMQQMEMHMYTHMQSQQLHHPQAQASLQPYVHGAGKRTNRNCGNSARPQPRNRNLASFVMDAFERTNQPAMVAV